MAEQINIEETVSDVVKAAKKAAPKRKPAAKKAAAKKPAAKKVAAKKVAAKKVAAKRKAAPRKAAPRKAAKKAAPTFASRAKDSSRKAFLASLGFYGKAFDQLQEQLESLQSELKQRRKQAEKSYNDLVKRGEKVEKDARKKVDTIDLPKFELKSFDRDLLDQQMEKAKARFEDLKETVRLNKAA